MQELMVLTLICIIPFISLMIAYTFYRSWTNILFYYSITMGIFAWGSLIYLSNQLTTPFLVISIYYFSFLNLLILTILLGFTLLFEFNTRNKSKDISIHHWILNFLVSLFLLISLFSPGNSIRYYLKDKMFYKNLPTYNQEIDLIMSQPYKPSHFVQRSMPPGYPAFCVHHLQKDNKVIYIQFLIYKNIILDDGYAYLPEETKDSLKELGKSCVGYTRLQPHWYRFKHFD